MRNAPPVAPSRAQLAKLEHEAHMNACESFKRLLSNAPFLLLTVSYGKFVKCFDTTSPKAFLIFSVKFIWYCDFSECVALKFAGIIAGCFYALSTLLQSFMSAYYDVSQC